MGGISVLPMRDYWTGAEQVPRGSVYKGAVHMARAGEYHGIQDSLLSRLSRACVSSRIVGVPHYRYRNIPEGLLLSASGSVKDEGEANYLKCFLELCHNVATNMVLLLYLKCFLGFCGKSINCQ